jgi:zinc protease
VLAELLGGSSTTSVLARKLTFEQDVALSASAFYSATALDYTTFGLSVVPSEGVSLQEAEDALDAALAEFLEEGVDPAQLERVRTRIRASEIYSRDSVQGRARSYGAALTSGLTVADVEEWTDLLMAVTPEDVMAAAEEVFDRDRAVTGWLRGPDSDVGGPATGDAPVEAPLDEVSQ